MNRLQRYKFLQIFGDDLQHDWFEVIFLGCHHLKLHQSVFEVKIFKKALADGIIYQVESKETTKSHRLMQNHTDGLHVGPDWQQYDYRITAKGDDCLRNEQISRDGDPSYYKNYDRTVNGKFGISHFAPLPTDNHRNGFSKSS